MKYVSRKSSGVEKIIKTLAVKLNVFYARRYVKDYPQMAVYAFDEIGININNNGRYERQILEAAMDFLVNSIGIRTGVCFDVGANIGNHALYFDDFLAKFTALNQTPRFLICWR
ncbi:hypothetical protein [Halothiobacillus sp. DCM-1]|uniref:hypothetical protein n=1 Tax=Halothiobacillus sp. DCM-1 TaxID=3112558 RepID=UPI003244B4AF